MQALSFQSWCPWFVYNRLSVPCKLRHANDLPASLQSLRINETEGRTLVKLSSVRRTAGRCGPHSTFSLTVFCSKTPTKRGWWLLGEKAPSLERDTCFCNISQHSKFKSLAKFVKINLDQKKEKEGKKYFSWSEISQWAYFELGALPLQQNTVKISRGKGIKPSVFKTVNVTMTFPKCTFDQIVHGPPPKMHYILKWNFIRIDVHK